MAAARDAFLTTLQTSGAAVTVLTPLDAALPNTLTVHCLRVDGRNLVPALDLAQVAASHGSACSSGSAQPPRVLTAIGLEPEAARACVRFSFSHRHDLAFALAAGTRVGEVLNRLQKKKPHA